MNNKDYLINEKQSLIDEKIRNFCSKIPKINNINDLSILDNIFYNYFTHDKTTKKFSRTVIEIFESKTFSGCSDIGMMISSILREKGILTVYVETAKIDWINMALNDLPGNELMQGHIFLEVYINGKWYLYDPTFHIVYDNYDMNNNNYPRNYYVFAKGLNANELGVFNTKDERKLALSKLKDYNYQDYINPNYSEINLALLNQDL